MRFTPFISGAVDEDLTQDYSTAERAERWRIGRKAFYQTYGPFGVKYLPLDRIRRAYPHDFQIKSGCSCAGTFPSRGVVVEYDDRQVLKLIPNKEKESDHIIALLNERVPGLDTEIPELYRKETRQVY